MNIQRFRSVAKASSLFLKVIAVFLILLLIFSAYHIFIADSNMWFNYSPGFSLLNSASGQGEGQTFEASLRSAAAIVTPILVLISVYVFWKGSQLFNQLAQGETPFTNEFARSIQKLSLILIVTDLLAPLAYSLIATIIIDGGHYLIIGVGTPFLVGIILYAVSEIFKYGIELQYLADQTV